MRSIIDLAHNLGKRVVAEGVETQEVWEWLVNAGCDAGQGNYLGIPMSAPELEHWVRTSAWGLRGTACHEPRGRLADGRQGSRQGFRRAVTLRASGEPSRRRTAN